MQFISTDYKFAVLVFDILVIVLLLGHQEYLKEKSYDAKILNIKIAAYS